MWIKICGVKNPEDARYISSLEVDAIGLVFAESSRKISVEQGQAISQAAGGRIQKIGVFVNPKKSELLDIFRRCNLDYVQLHGNESPGFCRDLNIPYIKSISIKEETDINKIDLYECSKILLDTYSAEQYGGSGKVFSWQLVKLAKEKSKTIYIAGGLHSQNVLQAIKESGAAGVDVSSGVESDGKKDLSKVKIFIDTVRSYRPPKL